MDYTKKIMYQSNYWYNDGLRKAQIRDLSGAIVSLRRSLQFNKGNIAARNLLGLVYYGRGEVAEALVEWIISKNLRPRDNIANEYIQSVQDSARELDVMNQAIKKYNQCLAYCEQNGEDVAIIQLKKVTESHPAFLKAQQLLALLYLHTGQYAKAKQVLKTARKLDTTNDMTLRYIHELTQNRGKKVRKEERREEKKKSEAVEFKHGNETIIQPVKAFAKELAGKFTVMNIIVGMLIGAAIIWYLIVPTVNVAKADKANKQMIEYSEHINAMEAQISAMTRTLDKYRAVESDSEAAMQNAASTADSYENLMTAAEQYNSGSYSEENVADTLLNINRDTLGAGGQEQFDSLAGSVYPIACEVKYASGVDSLNVGNYERALDNLQKVVRMDESYDDGGALLNLGLAYLRSGDSQTATTYLTKVNEQFPDTDKAEEAKNNLNMIAASTVEENKTDTAEQ